MRPFNGQREVIRRLQERNEARREHVNMVRGIGGLEPIKEFVPPTVVTQNIPRWMTTEMMVPHFGREYLTEFLAPNIIRDEDDHARIIRAGNRDVRIDRITEIYGTGAIANTNRNGIIRGTAANYAYFDNNVSSYWRTNDLGSLVYSNNEKAKALLNQDWSNEGEFLKEHQTKFPRYKHS